MLWPIFLMLVVIWLLGTAGAYALGGFIHLLLLIALLVLLLQTLSHPDVTKISAKGKKI